MTEGSALLESGNYEEAAAIFEQILSNFPADSAALNVLAEASFALGNLPGARQYSELALGSNPGDFRALNILGVNHCRDKDYETASNCLARAVQLSPHFLNVHLNLCEVLGRLTLGNNERFIDPGLLLPCTGYQSMRQIPNLATCSN